MKKKLKRKRKLGKIIKFLKLKTKREINEKV